jgi:hypothetical protein
VNFYLFILDILSFPIVCTLRFFQEMLRASGAF